MICSIIPPLRPEFHKGQAGRIGLIGGSREYTGAPYFSAISSMKTGADLSYSRIDCLSNFGSTKFLNDFNEILPKLHVLVIGPGLGRNDQILSNVGTVIAQVKERNMPIVLDADALYFISKCPEIVRGYTAAILTPNVAEFDRLYTAVFRSDPKQSSDKTVTGDDNARSAVELLARTLGHITILRKGPEDIVSNGRITYTCREPGSYRRCGGQGDLLSGALGTFTHWSHKAFESNQISDTLSSIYQNYSPTILACLASSMLTRRCARLAFQKHARSTTTTDMIQEIKNAFTALFPVD
ncbi:atp-dependent h-hydrate dehydratase-like protein [Dermatophagoides farinae]|uniref:ATP-dependent (S)-NAD(P)H-hydrate dehydratase n=1 Tax=Dermatophagoides farinae TaxID=6954 RepID=A0A9D4NV70_DERFA|nr:atp-dependent h-hydrate dehydratase-like protein [Dermatophagoides farinae]